MTLSAPRFFRSLRLQQAASAGPPVKRGEQSPGVRDLQRALIDLGFKMFKSTGGGTQQPDGIFGSETEATVKSFQTKQQLVADGIAGPKTLGRLDSIFRANDPFYENPGLAEARLVGELSKENGKFGASTLRRSHQRS